MEPTPFNHPMHIANTIAKRQRELAETLDAIDKSGATGKVRRRLTVQAHEIFYQAMTEVEQRIRITAS